MVVAQLAASSHGVVTRRQLLAAGVSRREIAHRLAAGALLREYRGVYRVGHRAPSIEARYLAAVLACGEGALLSGPAAGHLWGLVKGAAPTPEVTAPTERRVAGVATRRSRTADATRHRGIPITTVPFTLIALAAQLDAEALARACHEAGVRYGTTPRQVSRESSFAAPTRPAPRSCERSSTATSKSPSASSNSASSSSCATKGSSSRKRTAPPAPAASTAAGHCTASPSSSTATVTTAHATPGSRTAVASEKRAHAATTSVATRTATSSNNRR
jgi:Transcriptional regulator, AbiEi antitoxin